LDGSNEYGGGKMKPAGCLTAWMKTGPMLNMSVEINLSRVEKSNTLGAVPADSPYPIIRLTGVRKTYGRSVAVETIDLQIMAGEFFTFLGPSGSGKTTTLRLIAGFETPDAGKIELNGEDVAALPPYDRDVNTVFQDYALFPHMNLRDNVAYGLRAKHVPRAEASRRADAALAMVRLMDFAERKPAQLSGGQRQRVALARALVNRPLVLLLDEPLGALDLKLRHQMQTELKLLQKQTGITFVYVTHDQEEALAMSDRIAVFNRGRIEQIGSPFDLYEKPETLFVADFVGISNILKLDGATLMIRPEKIKLAPPGTAVPSGYVKLDGKVTESTYLGGVTRTKIILADGQELTSVEMNDTATRPPTPPGASIRAIWQQNSAVKF
jgi:putative spermidine/putrescine transport system ATP-binding protein